MKVIRYHRNAARYMRRMPSDRKEQIKKAVNEIAGLADPAGHANVKSMGGEWSGCMRLRVGRYRVVFHLVEKGQCLEVLVVGPRGDVY